jgi:hypothetical protein
VWLALTWLDYEKSKEEPRLSTKRTALAPKDSPGVRRSELPLAGEADGDGDGDGDGDAEGDGEGDDGQLPVMSVRATLVGEESSCHNAVMDLEIQVVHDES